MIIQVFGFCLVWFVLSCFVCVVLNFVVFFGLSLLSFVLLFLFGRLFGLVCMCSLLFFCFALLTQILSGLSTQS